MRKYVVVVFILIIVLWTANFLLPCWVDKPGIFGDMFGTVNSLFSGFALAGVVLTIFLQQNELKLQRKELELQREELKLTRGEFHQQNETLKIQRFENTLFQMLDLHHKIVSDMDTGRNRVETGRDVFRVRFQGFLSPKLSNTKNLSALDQIYSELSDKFRTDFSHYFRNLYRIIRMIDRTMFDLDDHDRDFNRKYYYTSIVRAQLSDYELLWLFYNCLSSKGKKFKSLVEQYGLLKNMPKSSVINEIHLTFIDDSAYQNTQRKNIQSNQ